MFFSRSLILAAALVPALCVAPESATSQQLGQIPLELTVRPDSPFVTINVDGKQKTTTIDPELQSYLTDFIASKHSPIAAVAVIDVKTGALLALAQGRTPDKWGGSVHSGVYTGFPAASLFKTVVAAAAFELAEIDPDQDFGLTGGCQHVRTTGVWLNDRIENSRNKMNLRRAYGRSCNGFFAKLAVNHLGLGIISDYARKFGWQTGVPADVMLPQSPFRPPMVSNSSVHVVGRYAAGFGYVGVSAIHAAWMMAVLANDGLKVPVKVLTETPDPDPTSMERLFSAETAESLRSVMDSTVRGGTASFAFRRGKHRKLRDLVGGKTGTLTGKQPFGLTTWFAGMMPLDNPEIAVAAVVVLNDDLWFMKGPNLAAEAFWAYYDQKLQEKKRVLSKRENH